MKPEAGTKKKLQCSHCPERFQYQSFLTAHFKSTHQDNPANPVQQMNLAGQFNPSQQANPVIQSAYPPTQQDNPVSQPVSTPNQQTTYELPSMQTNLNSTTQQSDPKNSLSQDNDHLNEPSDSTLPADHLMENEMMTEQNNEFQSITLSNDSAEDQSISKEAPTSNSDFGTIDDSGFDRNLKRSLPLMMEPKPKKILFEEILSNVPENRQANQSEREQPDAKQMSKPPPVLQGPFLPNNQGKSIPGNVSQKNPSRVVILECTECRSQFKNKTSLMIHYRNAHINPQTVNDLNVNTNMEQTLKQQQSQNMQNIGPILSGRETPNIQETDDMPSNPIKPILHQNEAAKSQPLPIAIENQQIIEKEETLNHEMSEDNSITDNEKKVWVCPICNDIFDAQSEYNNHCLKMHNTDDK